MNERVRREADEIIERYRDEIGPALDGRLIGVYLVGSYALGDLQPGSDVDFITVVDAPMDDAAHAEVVAVHEAVRTRHPYRALEGFYVASHELRRHPRDADDVLRYGWEKRLDPGRVTPVEWEILRRHGVRVAGPTTDDLGVFDASADLPAYSLENLSGYWEPWIRQFEMSDAWTDEVAIAWALEWIVLGVPRLHAAITTGAILSKSGAAQYSGRTFDTRFHDAIEASLQYRLRRDESTRAALLAQRRSALAFAWAVIGDARAS